MEENSTWIVASALGIWAFDNCDDAMEFGGELPDLEFFAFEAWTD